MCHRREDEKRRHKWAGQKKNTRNEQFEIVPKIGEREELHIDQFGQHENGHDEMDDAGSQCSGECPEKRTLRFGNGSHEPPRDQNEDADENGGHDRSEEDVLAAGEQEEANRGGQADRLDDKIQPIFVALVGQETDNGSVARDMCDSPTQGLGCGSKESHGDPAGRAYDGAKPDLLLHDANSGFPESGLNRSGEDQAGQSVACPGQSSDRDQKQHYGY